jgi:predicted dehydrogenase
MSKNRRLKLGLIGLGNIGTQHANYLKELEDVELVGVCDIIKEKADNYASKYNSKAFYNHKELFERSGLEAVIIAVPHYDHAPIAIEAFKRGLHVMCEKPLTVHVNEAKGLIQEYEETIKTNPDLKFGIMLMERTYPHYRKIKDILESGELGKLTRVTWINTAWFRSQAYYNSGGWRATWAGEGGGLLTNQCPHNIDMYQWLFGVPARVSGHAHIGKYHDIEVEDEVTAYFEHDNGMIGHFISTTGEAPGTNRLEIVGEYGKLIYENGKLVFYRNRVSMLKFLKETKEIFPSMENWYTEIPLEQNTGNAHRKVTERFVDVILSNEGKLIAYGPEGINAVTIANAIMLSSFNNTMVHLPINGDEYENKLKELIKTSKFVKTIDTEAKADMSNSYSK